MVENGVNHGNRSSAGKMEGGEDHEMVSGGEEAIHYLPKRMEA
jgi:hypothetical protein